MILCPISLCFAWHSSLPCWHTFAQLLELLLSALSLPGPSTVRPCDVIVDVAGRLAAAFGSASSAFAAIVGPQELWREYLRSSKHLPRSTTSASGASGKLQASYSLLEPVQAKFR